MYPVSRGRTAYQAHVQVPEGLFEEEHGREAFSGPCSHLYRLHPPTAWEDIQGPLRPHAFDLNRPGLMDAARQGPARILSNEDRRKARSTLCLGSEVCGARRDVREDLTGETRAVHEAGL